MAGKSSDESGVSITQTHYREASHRIKNILNNVISGVTAEVRGVSSGGTEGHSMKQEFKNDF